MKKTLLAALAALTLGSAAQAHQIWIEQADARPAVVRFGEFGENLRETSPGLLDTFGKPSARLLSASGEKALTSTKSATGFELTAHAEAGQSIVAEDAVYPIRQFKQGDQDVRSWYWPAARFITSQAALQPQLNLDIVPTGKAGEFRVVFKGQPLAKTKVEVAVQSGWMKEAHTDEQGLVHFVLPWKGSYVLQAGHIDRTPGERPGASGPEKYDGIQYLTTLSLVSAQGAAAIPAGPAAQPNK